MSIDLMGVPSQVRAIETSMAAINSNVLGLPWAVSAVPSGRLISGATTLTAGTVPSVSLGTNTTLQTLVDITGSGILRLCYLSNSGTTSAYVRLAIITDGVTILDYTSSTTGAARTLFGVGGVTGGVAFEWDIPYRSSLQIKAQQSATITATLYYMNLVAEPYAA